VPRCTLIPGITLFVFNTFPGFKCIVTALKSQTVAHYARTKTSATAIRIAGVLQAAYMTPAANGLRQISLKDLRHLAALARI
jgi:hypothetical protein